MHTQELMAKTIAVADDVYEMLAKEKRPKESFSDVLRRWHRTKGSLMDCFGLLADMPEEEFREMEAAIESVDRPVAEELGLRKRHRR
jgi:predicted CopG family antitoxin